MNQFPAYVPPFTEWINDLDLSSPKWLEEKIDKICLSVEDRLNPKSRQEYITVLRTHVLLEVWAQIRAFLSESLDKGDYFSNATLSCPIQDLSGFQQLSSNIKLFANLEIRSSKVKLFIPHESYLLLLFRNRSKKRTNINESSIIPISISSGTTAEKYGESGDGTENTDKEYEEKISELLSILHFGKNNTKTKAVEAETLEDNPRDSNSDSDSNTNSNSNSSISDYLETEHTFGELDIEAVVNDKEILKNDDQKQRERRNEPRKSNYPFHLLVKVIEADGIDDEKSSVSLPAYIHRNNLWRVTVQLSLNERTLDKFLTNVNNDDQLLTVIPIKSLAYLERDFDAVPGLIRMPLTPYLMGEQELIAEQEKSCTNLLDILQNDFKARKENAKQMATANINYLEANYFGEPGSYVFITISSTSGKRQTRFYNQLFVFFMSNVCIFVIYTDNMTLPLHLMQQREQIYQQAINGVQTTNILPHFEACMNISQQQACVHSLTKPLTLIHGPPGTGKTQYALLPILVCAWNALLIECERASRIEISSGMDLVWKQPHIGIFASSNQAVDEIVCAILKAQSNFHWTPFNGLPIMRMGNRINIDNCSRHRNLTSNADEKCSNIPQLDQQMKYYLDYKWTKVPFGDPSLSQILSRKDIIATKEIIGRYYIIRIRNSQNTALKDQIFYFKQRAKEIKTEYHTLRKNGCAINDGMWEYVKQLAIELSQIEFELSCLDIIINKKYLNQAKNELFPVLLNNSSIMCSTANFVGRCLYEKKRKHKKQRNWYSDILIETIPIKKFDIGLYDECCQMRESETLISMQFCKRAVLIGDPKQLKSTILYHGKYRSLLLNSCFQRLQQYVQPVILNVQYRMHPSIADFSSKFFYDDKLENAASVSVIENGMEYHTEGQQQNMQRAAYMPCKYNKTFHFHKNAGMHIFAPLVFFNVCSKSEQKIGGTGSVRNLNEIDFVIKLLSCFFKSNNGVFLDEIRNIGIIASYNAHRYALNARMKKLHDAFPILHKKGIVVECDTVDHFQGSERDIIIFTCARSNNDGNIGFLENSARLNVAMSRAKYAQWIVGDSECLAMKSKMWKGLVQYMNEKGVMINSSDCKL